MRFGRIIKILVVIIVLSLGWYIFNKYDIKSHFVIDAKTVKPVGEIHFSFEDSFLDLWNKSTTYPYKDFMRHGYDLCLMSELPKNQNPLQHRIYIEKETAETLKCLFLSKAGKKVTTTLNIAIGSQSLTTSLLESKKAEILNLIAAQKYINEPYPDHDYELCLISELPSNQVPLPGKVYFDHSPSVGMLKYMVLSPLGKKMVGEIEDSLGNSILLPEDPILHEQFKTRFKSLGANFDIEGGRFPLTKTELEQAKYNILQKTAQKGLTSYKNSLELNTSMLIPTRFVMDNGKIIIPIAEEIHIKYYGQDGKEFRSLRIGLINRRGASLEEVIPQLKALINSIDAAGWQRAPGYEHIIGKLEDKLIVIRLFDIPRPKGAEFMKWTKGRYELAIGGYAEIEHYSKEKKPSKLVIIMRLEIIKDLNFK